MTELCDGITSLHGIHVAMLGVETKVVQLILDYVAAAAKTTPMKQCLNWTFNYIVSYILAVWLHHYEVKSVLIGSEVEHVTKLNYQTSDDLVYTIQVHLIMYKELSARGVDFLRRVGGWGVQSDEPTAADALAADAFGF